MFVIPEQYQKTRLFAGRTVTAEVWEKYPKGALPATFWRLASVINDARLVIHSDRLEFTGYRGNPLRGRVIIEKCGV